LPADACSISARLPAARPRNSPSWAATLPRSSVRNRAPRCYARIWPASDAETFTSDALADGVLLDAPCTATGTIRRHPDIPWRKSAVDVGRMAPVQARLLDHAATLVRPKGLLIYVVCSLEAAEGPDRVAAFLAKNAGFRRRAIDATEVGGDPDLVTSDGDLRTLPCHGSDRGGMDGFYAARLERL
jgi:16S rRNA (cytosine967-C5)-methyltransferase